MLNKFIFLTIGFAAPLLLWNVELLLPFPHIIEELFKFFSLLWISTSEFKSKSILSKQGLILGILFAVLFTLSESIFYLMNLAILNQFQFFPKRVVYTGILHIATTLMILIGVQKKWFIKVISLLLAVGIHYLYNTQVANF